MRLASRVGSVSFPRRSVARDATPKLRLASVLALTWAEHIDAEFHYISVRRHTTATKVVPISEQLRTILHDARLRTHTYVVEHRQRPIKSPRYTSPSTSALRLGV